MDPIGLAGGLNLYAFATGDPVNFTDPFGLRPCPPCFGGGGGFGGGGAGRSWDGAREAAAEPEGNAITTAGDMQEFLAAATNGINAAAAGPPQSDPAAASPPVTIKFHKQLEHIHGTKAYYNRKKQNPQTSAFRDGPSAYRYVMETWHRGTVLLNRSNVRELKFDHAVGIGPNGGDQYWVRVHVDSKNRIHGYPAGPEDPGGP